MRPISDALELLTAQHEAIHELVVELRRTRSADVLDALVAHVVSHLALEQGQFYPVISSTLTRDVLDELCREHDAIKNVLAELICLDLDGRKFEAKLADLASLLAGHAGWQESQLFVTVAETMSVEALAALGGRLKHFDPVHVVAA